MRASPSPSSSVTAALRLGVQTMIRRPLLGGLFLGLVFVQGALQGALIWTLREVLVAYSGADAITPRLVLVSSLVVLTVWVLRASSAFLAQITSVRLARRIEIETMLDVLSRLLALPFRFFTKSSQGDLIISAYHDLKGIRMVTLQVGTILLSVSTLLGLFLAAWSMSPKLAVIGLVAVPIGMVPAYWLGRRITQASDKERQATGSLYDSFLQVMAGIQVIKVNRARRYVMDRAQAVGKDLIRHNVDVAQDQALTGFLFETVSGLGLIAMLVLGGSDVAEGRLDWQSLLSLLIAVMAVYGPVKTLLSTYTAVRGIMPNLDRVERILEEPPLVEAGAKSVPLPDAPKQIAFRDVSFGYDDEQVLQNVSFTVERGETIGIVGHSGAGKSTLIALLLRFYEPTSGEIQFDGVSLRDVSYEDLMRRCAIVLQEPFLFIDTVANNIRIGRPEATMEEVMAAARAANVHDEIMAMEQGYDTVVGRGRDSRGVSVGQKQRITIAAALLKNAPLLFLDEATSNLDAVSERKVQQAIDRLMEGRTTFVIAHRLSTLRNADRILVMDRGRIAAFGVHDELLATSAIYQRLWRHQVGDLAAKVSL